MTRFGFSNRISAAVFFAAILFALPQINLAQSPTGQVIRSEDLPKDTPVQTETPPKNMFSSLRFWDKNKKPAADTIAPVQPVVKPEGTSTKIPPAVLMGGSAFMGGSAISSADASANAPTPPPIPLWENKETVPSATMVPSELPLASTETAGSAYAFDSREWVDYYSTQAVSERTLSPADSAGDREIPATNVINTSLRVPQNEEWNGTVSEFTAPALPPQTGIDLTPTYRKQLPYIKVYGVIVVQANFPLEETASIFTEIQALLDDLHKYMGVSAPKEKIELCLFKDEASYKSFVITHFQNAPDRQALFVKLDKKPATLMVQRTKDFERDLRHEMTHAIIHSSVDTVPIWLDEGLAKYFEVPSADRAEKNPYMKKVRWAVRFGSVPSLSRLSKLETAEDMGPKEYQESWAWVHYLIHRSPNTHQLLASYIQLLARLDAEPRKKRVTVPPLKLYLDEVVKNQREDFIEHFDSKE